MSSNLVRVNTIAATSSGSTSVGAIALGFSLSGGTATVANIALHSSHAVINFPVLERGRYPAISYTVSGGGTLNIVEVIQ